MASPVTIAASVGATMSAATGQAGQGHLCYASNANLWFLVYLSGTQNLSAVYSSTFTGGWTAPTGSPVALRLPHGSEGRNFGFAYANLGSIDVLHASETFVSVGSSGYHSRFTLGTTWTWTHDDTGTALGTSTDNHGTPSGTSSVVDSTGRPVDASPYIQSARNPGIARATNVDSGASWTAGFGATAAAYTTSFYNSSSRIVALGGGNLIYIGDNAATDTNFTNLQSATWNGSVWSAAVNVFGAAVTATNHSNWNAIGRTATDVHAVALGNNSNTYVHARNNGASWGPGDTIPSLAYGTLSGIALATDGANIWADVIDSAGNVQQTKWVSGVGWTPWTVVCPIVSHTRAYLTSHQTVVGSTIGLAWTENNGAGNFDIVGALVSSITPVGGTIARTGGLDTLASPAAFRSGATLARTGGVDTLAAVGSCIFGTLARTGGPDTLAASGRMTAAASLVRTGGADTLVSPGSLLTIATLVRAESADLRSMIGNNPRLASLAVIARSDTLAAAGWCISATMVRTGGADTLASPAVFRAVATIAKTEARDTTAFSTFASASGVLSKTAGPDTVVVAGDAILRGVVAKTERPDILVAIGRPGVVGTLIQTEALGSFVGSGRAICTAVLSGHEQGDTLAAGSATQYRIYANTGDGGAINYVTPIATTSRLTYTTNPLAYPSDWRFGVRAFDPVTGLEEHNLDCAVEIILSTAAVDVTNQPSAPFGLRAFAVAP